MDTLYNKVRKNSAKSAHFQAFSRDIGSKLFIYKFSQHRRTPPMFPKAVSVDQTSFGNNDNQTNRSVTPIINIITADPITTSNKDLNFAEESKYFKPEYKHLLNVPSRFRSFSKLKGVIELKSSDAFVSTPKKQNRKKRKFNSIVKETSPEMVMSIYGVKGRRSSSNDLKGKNLSIAAKRVNLGEFKQRLDNFHRKSKDLLNQLQQSVLGNKDSLKINPD